MPSHPSKTRPDRNRRSEDREARAEGGAVTRVAGKLKGLLGRPIGLKGGEGGKLQFVLIERRRAPTGSVAAETRRMVDELQVRLLASDPASVRMTQQVVLVADRLLHKGWAGVDELPPKILALAIVQAEALQGDRPSSALGEFLQRLKLAKVGAAVRTQGSALRDLRDDDDRVVVSESSQEEYEATERGWADTQHPAQEPPDEPPPAG